MKPAYSRTKEVTDKEGNTEKVVEPLIMERHEQVAIPGQETHVTTVQQENQNTTETTHQAAASVKPVVAHKTVKHSHVACRARRAQHVAYKPRHRYVAVASKSAKTEQNTTRTVINEQTIQSPTTIIERRDPALDLP